ncbi:MAG: DUF4837 family protein [Bacteroidales bacterium]|jgi:hypothetical protein|nr:DUF4837 family protein [Bacteroidales bacterium]
MKKFVFFIVVAMSAMVFSSCDGTGSQGKGLLSSSGRSGEILIVCDDDVWQGASGDSLQAILMRPVLGLPQDEPMFLLSRISEDRFREAYKRQRNIIVFSINPDLWQPKVSVTYNRWAQPQILVRIEVQDKQQIVEVLSQYRETLTDYLLDSEMKRFQRAQQSKRNFQASSTVEQLFHISMTIPEGFIFAVKDSSFAWLRKDTKDWTQSILIYTQPYTDTNQFHNEEIVKERNIRTKQYVFGSTDSSYTVIDEDYIPALSEYMRFDEGYAVRTVGLWKTVRDFMGGAFVNMSILDTKNNRIVTIDGFLYAPSDNKRDLMRQLEAMMLSVKFQQTGQ